MGWLASNAAYDIGAWFGITLALAFIFQNSTLPPNFLSHVPVHFIETPILEQHF